MKRIGLGKIVHHLINLGWQVDALSGEAWELLDCPECGYQERLYRDPYRPVMYRPGDGMPTAEDAESFAELAKTPDGRLELSQRLARIPSHVYSESAIDGAGVRWGHGHI